jgi:arylsulfatase A-like enzyme
MRALLALLVVSAIACTPGGETDARPEPRDTPDPRPNVLLIVTDDQRADTLDVMPATRKWFAKQGTTFPNAFATTPLCCPSRASIFTGQYPHNHGVLKNQDSHDLRTRSTLQYYFGEETDYRTALVGKYLNSWSVDEDPPHWDRWASYSGRYYGKPFNVNGRVTETNDYSTYHIAKRARGFLRSFERPDERPWFLYIAPVAPHAPFHISPKYRAAPVPSWKRNPAIDERGLGDKPKFTPRPFDLDKTEVLRRKQLRTLMSVDDLVRKVMQTLTRLDEAEDTLAIYTSDQGLLWGEHGMFAKRLPYTQSIAAPLMIRWPGYFDAGATDDSLVANIDLAPTIMEVAGLIPDRRYPVDGRSLLASEERDELYIEQLENWRVGLPDWRSLRTDEFQYVEYYARDGDVMAREYYDLVTDPWQLRNLLGDADGSNDPDLGDLSERLAAFSRCSGASCFAP